MLAWPNSNSITDTAGVDQELDVDSTEENTDFI